MKNFLLTCTILVLCNSMSVFAQTIDSTKSRPFQISFIYPMGSDGVYSKDYTHTVSFNIFAGYSDGLSGVEIGGFANTLRHDMKGVQIAGFSNVVLGETNGCQISGFSNYSNKLTKGVQISGFSNVINDSAKVSQIAGFSNVIHGTGTGIQIAGFSNTCSQNTEGVQLAGFSNVIHGRINGCQIAGFSNVATDSAISIQIAGFSNVVKGKTKGAQIAGFSNLSTNSLQGIQIAGFSNVIHGRNTGCQIAGFSNVCKDTLVGLQISGMVNIADNLHGAQISFINICDTVEAGIPIGFLCIVKKGYQAFELNEDESLFTNVSFVTGVPQFYNIFSIGTRNAENSFMWSYGYGVGSKIQVNDKVGVNLELLSKNIIMDSWNEYSINTINTGRINASYRIFKNIDVFGGLSYNAFVTNQKDNEGHYTDSGIIPWSHHTEWNEDVLVKIYPGVNVGVRVINLH